MRFARPRLPVRLGQRVRVRLRSAARRVTVRDFDGRRYARSRALGQSGKVFAFRIPAFQGRRRYAPLEIDIDFRGPHFGVIFVRIAPRPKGLLAFWDRSSRKTAVDRAHASPR